MTSTQLDRFNEHRPLLFGIAWRMLGNVADYYDDEIGHDLSRVLTLLEPALLIFMGGIIAVMLIAMYLPLFQLQSIAQ